MGVRISKQVAERVITACEGASDTDRIDRILENENVGLRLIC